MKPRGIFAVFVVVVVAFLVVMSGYTVRETETAIVTRFGRPVGMPKTEPGLYFKVPLIETVTKLEKRVLEWDGPAVEMPTKDKTYIEVDAFGRWRINDPARFFVALRDLRSAQPLRGMSSSRSSAATSSAFLKPTPKTPAPFQARCQ
jgi:membrane protease subunit HflC